MNLDPQSVIYLIVVSACIMSIGLFALGRSLPSYMKGITRWTYAMLIQALGWFLVDVHGNIPDFISTVVGNTLIVLAIALYYHALKEFKDESFHKVIPYTIVILVFTASFYFSVATDDAPARIAAISAGAALLAFLCGQTLLWGDSSSHPHSHWFTGIGFLGCGVMLAARVFGATLLIHDPVEMLSAQDPLQSLYFLSFYLIVTAFSFGFMLMCHDRYVAEIEKLVMMDSVTLAYNRRAIQYLMEKEISRSRRTNLPISVLMIDIDRFKSINDTYGHAAGDAALLSVAKTVAGQLREPDLIGRYGGDEFLVVLPDTGQLEASKIAERIRSRIEQTKIAIGKGSVTVTLSIGVAELDRNAPDEQAMICRADSAMYESKNRGTNRVQLASDG